MNYNANNFSSSKLTLLSKRIRHAKLIGKINKADIKQLETANADQWTAIDAIDPGLSASDIAATYLKQSDAMATYLSKFTAEADYLNKTDANLVYAKKATVDTNTASITTLQGQQAATGMQITGVLSYITQLQNADTAFDQRTTTVEADMLSLGDRVTTVENSQWRRVTVVNMPVFGAAANLASYLPDMVKGTDYFGFGEGVIENVGMDNQGTQLYRCFSITITDPGFDVMPLFAEEIAGTSDVTQFRTPNWLPPHTIPLTIAKAPGVGVYTICKRAITANYRTQFLVVVRKDVNANYPSKLIINWVKRDI